MRGISIECRPHTLGGSIIEPQCISKSMHQQSKFKQPGYSVLRERAGKGLVVPGDRSRGQGRQADKKGLKKRMTSMSLT